MRSGAHGRARQGTRRAVAALAFTLAAAPALAQRVDGRGPTFGQPDNPAAGLETGPNGLPGLRRRLPEGSSRDEGRGSPGGDTTDGSQSGGNSLRSPLDATTPSQTGTGQPQIGTRGALGGQRTGASTTRTNNLGPSALLRTRAFPLRKSGSATRRITQEVTQIPTPALRLTPVIRQAVSGVPVQQSTTLPTQTLLPLLALSPALGLLTPGFILGTDLARAIPPDPAYAPLGYKIGSFLVFPTIAQGVGYDTNPDQVNRGLAKGSVALRTEAGLSFASDWSSSALVGALRGAYLETPQNEAASRPAADGNVRMRIDATRDLSFDPEFHFLVDTQRTDSVNFVAQAGTTATRRDAAATSRPLFAVYGGSVGATETFNRLSVTLRGSIDRTSYDDARVTTQMGGQTVTNIVPLSNQNLNQYGLQLRAAYEISPDISPFVDVLTDTRIYDQRVDPGNVQRNSDGISVAAGASVGLARSVTGEVSAGFLHRDYADLRLRDISAPLLSASLTWTVSPLTAVRLIGATAIGEAVLPGYSGIITKTASLEVQHNIFRNVAIVLGGSVLNNHYAGRSPITTGVDAETGAISQVNSVLTKNPFRRITESGFSYSARVEYAFTRYLTLRGTYIHQAISSPIYGTSFHDNTYLVGLRFNP